MKTKAFLIHALSPLHAGAGHSTGAVDLPVARMKGTGIPFLPGSSIKGVLRDARREKDPERAEAVFGPEGDPSAHAGALIVGDARLIALPVRSYRGAFAWVTSPLLLALAKRDLGRDLPVPAVADTAALTSPASVSVHEGKLYLEDLDLPARADAAVSEWASMLAPRVSPDDDIFSKRFAIVDDDTMSFLWDMATQVDARVRLDENTRTVAQGALWLEESLPPETLLIGVLAADRSRRQGVNMDPEDVLKFALEGEEVLQLGGHATIGRGRSRLIPLD